jgi:flagellar biosynthesis/type III secretory pathway M-ring protein FliF/YscJ
MPPDPKTGRALVAQPASGSADADIDAATALHGVQGKVRQAVVNKLRQLVDRDPEAFVRGMRSWMAEGRQDIE